SKDLWLLEDAGGPWLGPITAGSGSLHNSQCILNGAGTSVSGSGNNLTINYSISFIASYAGPMNVYLSAADGDHGWNTGQQQFGTWTVTAPPCTPRNFISGSTNPTTVVAGSGYQVSCDYGDATYAYIRANNCSAFVGFQGTAAIFNCTAPSTPGSYAQSCKLETAPPQNYCARDLDPAVTLTVT